MEAKRLERFHISKITYRYTLKYDWVCYLVEVEGLDVSEDTRRFEKLSIKKMSVH